MGCHSNWTGECIVDRDVMPMIDLAIYHRHKKHSYLGWGGLISCHGPSLGTQSHVFVEAKVCEV